MNKIEALAEGLKKIMDSAKTPEELKEATEVYAKFEEVKKENSELVEKNAKLFTAYKEAVVGQTFKFEQEQEENGESPSFEEALAQVIAKQKE